MRPMIHHPAERRMLPVLDQPAAAIGAVPVLRISMVEETQLDVIRDPGRAVQKLLNHMPRVVENQQRLGPIARQLACDHHGLEPQVNVFLWFGHSITPYRYGPGPLNRGRVRCVYPDCPDVEPWYPAI